MITVFLYGKLAEEFGSSFNLNVSSPAEACRALEANHPGKFYTSLRDGSYTVFRGDISAEDTDTVDTLNLLRPNDDIHIVPVVQGSKNAGIGQIILGTILIVAAVVYSYYTWGGDGTGMTMAEAGLALLEGGAGSTVALMGTAMVLGGVASMLTPVPKLDGAGLNENVDDKKSFIFDGPENVSTQGGPVPLVYGRFRVGSVVISRSLTVEDI